MKAVAIQAFGNPEGLAVIDIPDPSPASGQVLIATEAIGVGGVDAVIRRGTLGAFGFRAGHILGGEIAGTVAAVGDGVGTSWLGRRVWAFTGLGGGYAEQAIAPAAALIPIPAGVSAADAVTLGALEWWPTSDFATPLCPRRVGAGARRGRWHRGHDDPARGS